MSENDLENKSKFEINKRIKKIKDIFLVFDALYQRIISNQKIDLNEKDEIGVIYHGLDALYKQNEIIIEQNKEILDYFKEIQK